MTPLKLLTKCSVAVYFIFGLSTTPALAWNAFGHMSVAYVAYQNMTPEVREKALSLLKLNPYYEKWKAEVSKNASPEQEKEQLFMIAATWPDQIRDDKTYSADGPENGAHPGGPEARQNIGYTDHLLHKYWHHFDKPMTEDNTKLPQVRKPNALTQIETFRKALSSSSVSPEVKSYDLTWLMHLVGDMHQPLHSITRVSSENPDGDDNALKVRLKPPGADSLHWYWDCAAGTDGVDKVAAFGKTLPAANAKAASDLDVHNWIEDGFTLAVEKAYVAPIGKGNGPYVLTDKYKQTTFEVAKKQIALAGLRLANILNADLK
jgi:hypothetical protein